MAVLLMVPPLIVRASATIASVILLPGRLKAVATLSVPMLAVVIVELVWVVLAKVLVAEKVLLVLIG